MNNIIRKVLLAIAVCCICAVGVNTVNVFAEENQALLTVDLVIFAGQSNMSGVGGDVKQTPAVPHGCGYEYRNGKDPAGLYEITEPFGLSANGYLSDPDGVRNGTLVSSFANHYFGATGVPVLAFSAARGGTGMDFWTNVQVKNELFMKYQNIKYWCESNHVKIRRQYVVWLQGESDAIAGMSGSDYQNNLKDVFSAVLADGIEQIFIITPGQLDMVPDFYGEIVKAQKELCNTSPYFTLATDSLYTLPNTYLVDGIHYNQGALNLVGAQAATAASMYTALKGR